MWTLKLSGTSANAEDEFEVVELFKRVCSIFTQDGSLSELSNAEFVGSHTTTHNLLSNPEREAEEAVFEPETAPEPRPKWDTSLPTDPAPFAETEGATEQPVTQVHSSGPDYGQSSEVSTSETDSQDGETVADLLSEDQQPAEGFQGGNI